MHTEQQHNEKKKEIMEKCFRGLGDVYKRQAQREIFTLTLKVWMS